MPRRPPGSLRHHAPAVRSRWIRYRDVPGLSGRANAAIRLLERRRWLPGTVSVAVSVWAAHVHGTRRRWRPWEDEFVCSCCGDGWARTRVQEAIDALPGHAAAELRTLAGRLEHAD